MEEGTSCRQKPLYLMLFEALVGCLDVALGDVPHPICRCMDSSLSGYRDVQPMRA